MLKTPTADGQAEEEGEGLGGAVYEHGPKVLRNHEGLLGVLAALHADGAIPVEDVDRERFWFSGADEHATK